MDLLSLVLGLSSSASNSPTQAYPPSLLQYPALFLSLPPLRKPTEAPPIDSFLTLQSTIAARIPNSRLKSKRQVKKTCGLSCLKPQVLLLFLPEVSYLIFQMPSILFLSCPIYLLLIKSQECTSPFPQIKR